MMRLAERNDVLKVTLTSTAKRAVFGVRRDPLTGHLYYRVANKRLYVRSPLECERPKHRRYAFDQIYFKHYLPSGSDVVVDFGAGVGSEIVALAEKAPGIRYIAVEIQPWVYECLCLTLAQLPEGYVPFGLAVGTAPVVHITPTSAGIDASLGKGGPVPVQGITWREFVTCNRVDHVDLLKMNVEGAEGDLLEHINLDQVERVIVSTHDFMADRGLGEHYRTRARVEKRLRDAGYRLSPIGGKEDFMRSWIFADRPPRKL